MASPETLNALGLEPKPNICTKIKKPDSEDTKTQSPKPKTQHPKPYTNVTTVTTRLLPTGPTNHELRGGEPPPVAAKVAESLV